MRSQAGSHVPARRRRSTHRRQDGLENDARDGATLQHTPREGLPQVQLLQGERGTKLRQHHRPQLQGRWPLQKLGTDVTEFKLSFGKAYLAPVYDFASKEIVAHSISMHPNLAQQQEMLQILMDAKPQGAEPILHSDMGWQYQHETYIKTLADNGFIQSMSRKGNCIDNGATEQVFGHLKDEFFRGQDWQTFESFKADLNAYITYWNTQRRQVKLKGLTPAEYRDQALQQAA